MLNASMQIKKDFGDSTYSECPRPETIDREQDLRTSLWRSPAESKDAHALGLAALSTHYF